MVRCPWYKSGYRISAVGHASPLMLPTSRNLTNGHPTVSKRSSTITAKPFPLRGKVGGGVRRSLTHPHPAPAPGGAGFKRIVLGCDPGAGCSTGRGEGI